MGTTTKTVPPVTLTQRHLLGIEGMPVTEIEALLARSHFFASVIDGSIPDSDIPQSLAGKTAVSYTHLTLPTTPYV